MNRFKINLIILLFCTIHTTLYPAITKGPYLVSPEKNSMTVMWESNNSHVAEFAYWQNKNDIVTSEIRSFDNQNGFYLFRVKLDGLQADHKYFYRVIYPDTSSESYFITAPLPGKPFTFVAVGDTRSGHDIFSKIVQKINEISPRLVISMGDLVLRGRNFTHWGPHYFEPSKSIINHIPLISTVGDHETFNKYSGYHFYYYFRNGENTNKLWFSYDYGSVHFVSLDFRGEFNDEMIDWFKEDMSRSQAKWKIVYMHRPTYNIGGHRTNWGNPVWQRLYSENKVDIVFAGHSHLYEHFYPMQYSTGENSWPVTYIVTGGGGAILYDETQNEYVVVSRSVNHFNVISVSNDTLKIKTLLLDGSVLDQFEIVKQNGVYSDSYLDLAKPQEEMDIYMAFASRLRLKFKTMPSVTIPSVSSVSFESKGIMLDIPFKLHLSKESAKYYRFEPIEGILGKGEKLQRDVVVYVRGKIGNIKRYFDPPMLFEVTFEYNDREFVVIGRESRYYPQKK